MRGAGWMGLVVGAIACGGPGVPGSDCGRGVVDCSGTCVSKIYLEDGVCDGDPAAVDRPYLSCPELGMDGGDCGTCGDGAINAGEACDDGGQVAGDGCSPTCQWEADTSVDTARVPDTAEAICGNGRVELPEQCDDGNQISGDGCQSDCRRERLNADIALVSARFGLNTELQPVAVTLGDLQEPPRFEIYAAKVVGTSITAECTLSWRPRDEDVAIIPPEGLTGPATPLQQWLIDRGLVWGFQILPDTDTRPRRDAGCYLDLDAFAGDPFSVYLGRQPVYVGVGDAPAPGAVDSFGTGGITGVDNLAARAAGAAFRVPETLLGGTDRDTTDAVALVAEVSGNGAVLLSGNQIVFKQGQAVVQSGRPSQGWYQLLASVVYRPPQR